ncbi:MAG: DNA repair protein RecO C-terminal domain-containing protein [Muribaculaceae bacterium]|nr:DNA repair protein RecO C-terminal domain-containing protein [Muribaculaceae bacterium]
MLQNTTCIALRTVKVSDRQDLLTVWSREAGRLSFTVPAGNSQAARRRRALTSPLAVFECVADIRPGRDIHTIRDLNAAPYSLALVPSPSKSLTAMFLAEVLDNLLRKTEPDSSLSRFIFTSLEIFSQLRARAAANFHIVFLLRLMHFAGIEPDMGDYYPGRVFDIREGRFLAARPLHGQFLDGDECRMLALMQRVDYFTSGRLPLSRASRNIAVDRILSYYQLHLGSLSNIKSLEILRRMGD